MFIAKAKKTREPRRITKTRVRDRENKTLESIKVPPSCAYRVTNATRLESTFDDRGIRRRGNYKILTCRDAKRRRTQ